MVALDGKQGEEWVWQDFDEGEDWGEDEEIPEWGGGCASAARSTCYFGQPTRTGRRRKMVVSPDEIRRAQEARAREWAKMAASQEPRIDQALREAKDWPAHIPVEEDTPDEVLRRLQMRYRNAGWKVGLLVDGREGKRLTFDFPPQARGR